MKAPQLKSKLLMYVWLAFEFILNSNLALAAAPQTISWTGTTNTILSQNVAYPIGATSSSGLTVTLHVEHGPAVLANGEIIVTNVGTVVVTAQQVGSLSFTPATTIKRFNVRQIAIAEVGYLNGLGKPFLSGNLAYIPKAQDGFKLIDVSNPTKPKQVGEFKTNGLCADLVVAGGYAYVADSPNGLRIVDVSNPAQPFQVGSYRRGNDAFGINLMGKYALLEGYFEIDVIDVSDPANPFWVGKYDDLHWGSQRYRRGLGISGTYAYMTDFDHGIQVVDFTDPSKPVRVGSCEFEGYAWDLELVGEYAYVADWNGTVQIVDVSNPADPKVVENYDPNESLQNAILDVEIAGDYAFLAKSFGGLEVLDVSYRIKPERVGEFKPDFWQGYLHNVEISGDNAYAGIMSGFRVLKMIKGYPNTIDLNPPKWIAFTNGFILLPHTSSNGAEVSYSILYGPAEIEGNRLVFTGTGSVGLRAQQIEDGVFLPANFEWFFEIGSVPQVIAWKGATNEILNFNTAYPLSASASSGLPLSIRVEGGPGVWTNGNLTITGPGWVLVTAEQEGGNGYLPEKSKQYFNVKQVNLEELDQFVVRDTVRDMEVVGDLYYLAAGTAGLEIFARTNSLPPARVGGLAPPEWWGNNSYAEQIRIKGRYVYMTYSNAGLRVIDVADPLKPVEMGFCSTKASAFDLEVVGNYAYVGSSYGLEVIDITDAAKPLWAAGYPMSGAAKSLEIVGGLAYVADDYAGMRMIDVSSPTNLKDISTFYASGMSNLEVEGKYAYTAGNGGLQIIDISNSNQPQLEGAYVNPTYRMDVAGNYAYLMTFETGLGVLDVGNPALPLKIPSDHPSISGRIKVVGDRLYAFGGYGFRPGYVRSYQLHTGYPNSLDFDPPVEMMITAESLMLPPTSSNGRPVKYSVVSGPAQIEEGKLVVGGEGEVILRAEQNAMDGYVSITKKWSIMIYRFSQDLYFDGVTQDVLALNTPYPLTCRASSSLPVTLRVESGPAVLSNGTITITNLGTVTVTAEQAGNATYLPANVRTRRFNVRQALKKVGSLELACCGQSAQVVGKLAYVVGPFGGLQIVDVSDTAHPVKVGTFAITGYPDRIRIEGTMAYIWNPTGGLEIVDVTDPTIPVRVGRSSVSSEIHGIAVSGHYAYLAEAQAGLEIIDMEDPSEPMQAGMYHTSGTVWGVHVEGNFAYLSDGGNGLQILDLTNPTSPLQRGILGTGGNAYEVRVQDDYAYVLDGKEGLNVIDVMNPENPNIVGRYASRAMEFRVAGKYGCLLKESTLIEIIDLTNPALPILAGEANVGVNITAIDLQGTNVYAIDSHEGLLVYEIRVGDPQELNRRLPSLVTMESIPLTAVGFSSSGLPITVSVVSGPARINAGQVLFTGPGVVVLRAEQAGNEVYMPTSSDWSVTVSPTPSLSVRSRGGYVEVAWDTDLYGFTLQFSDFVSPESEWIDMFSDPFGSFPGQYTVYAEPSGTQQFFRLVKR